MFKNLLGTVDKYFSSRLETKKLIHVGIEDLQY